MTDYLSGFHFLLFNILDFSKFSTLSSFNSFIQSTNIYAAGTVHLEGKKSGERGLSRNRGVAKEGKGQVENFQVSCFIFSFFIVIFFTCTLIFIKKN